MAERNEVLLGDRIEEIAVPVVEPDLAEHVADQHEQDAAGKQRHRGAITAAPKALDERETSAAAPRPSYSMAGGWNMDIATCNSGRVAGPCSAT